MAAPTLDIAQGIKFCTVPDVVACTRIGSGYSAHDRLIQTLLPVAAVAVQTYCRRNFIAKQRTQYFSTPGGYDDGIGYDCQPVKFYLDELHVTDDNSSIQVRLQTGFYNNSFTTDWTQVPQLAAQYIDLDQDRGIITLLYPTPKLRRGMQVIYNAGYSADSTDVNLIIVPPELRRAAALQAAFLLGLIVNQDVGQQEKNAQGTHKTLKLDPNAIHGLVPQARALVANYRRTLVSTIY